MVAHMSANGNPGHLSIRQCREAAGRISHSTPVATRAVWHLVEAVRKGNLLFLTGCFPRKAARRSSLDVSALNSMWKRGAMRLMLRRFNALAVAAAPFEIPR